VAISSPSGSRQSGAIFVWCRRFGDITVNRSSRSFSPRWAVIVLAAAILALTGCGRKGPLDLPPTGTQSSAPVKPDTEAEEASKPSVFNPGFGSDAAPAAPKGTKKSFVLDPLLNSN
jgi:predicted small lipoprotein YifL